MDGLNPLLEFSGANANESNAVSVARVHIRLNLENEAGEPSSRRVDLFGRHRTSSQGLRGEFHEAIKKGFQSEIGQSAAEKNRRLLAATDTALVEFGASAFEQFEPFHDALREMPQGFLDFFALGFAVYGLLVDGCGSVVSSGEQIETTGQPIVGAAKFLACANRPIDRHGFDAQNIFDFTEQIEGVLPVAIHLIDESEDGDFAHPADFEESSGLGFHALGRVNQHDRAVGGYQRPVGVFAEIAMARGVEDIDPDARVICVHDGTRDGNSALFFDLQPVAGRMLACFLGSDGASLPHGSPEKQDFFGEGRFAGIRVGDDGKRTSAQDFLSNLVLENVHNSRGDTGLEQSAKGRRLYCR